MKSKQESIRYVAFLRAINVGGRFVKMEVLVKIFSSIGFDNVKTFIQSGNIIFDSGESDLDELTGEIQKGLAKKLGYEVDVMVRTVQQLEAMIRRNPFKKLDDDAKISVAFMSAKPKTKLTMPLFSARKDVEIIEIKDRDAFCVHHLVNGQWGYPNIFIEKSIGVKSTVRFWSSLNKLVELAKSF